MGVLKDGQEVVEDKVKLAPMKMNWNLWGQTRPTPPHFSLPTSKLPILMMTGKRIWCLSSTHIYSGAGEAEGRDWGGEGVLEELRPSCCLTPTRGANRSVKTCMNYSSTWPCTSLRSVSMSTASLPPPKSCLNLPLWPILIQNYTRKGTLGNIVAAWLSWHNTKPTTPDEKLKWLGPEYWQQGCKKCLNSGSILTIPHYLNLCGFWAWMVSSDVRVVMSPWVWWGRSKQAHHSLLQGLGQWYKWMLTYQMSKYLKTLNQDKNLLFKVYSIFIP